MSSQNSRSKVSAIFWRVIISLVGAGLIIYALMNISLFFFGQSASATVNTRRFGGADMGRSAEYSYQWSLDYKFKDKKGVIHSGHSTRQGNAISVRTDSRVYYFAFAPFINSLESDAEPNLMQIVFVGLGIFLIVIMNRNKKIKNVVAEEGL